jgi:hypothetical protein
MTDRKATRRPGTRTAMRTFLAWFRHTMACAALAGAACGSNPYVGTTEGNAAGGTSGTATKTTTATGTGGADGGNPDTAPADPTLASFTISVALPRQLDLVVMIDNSPSMGPKVAKLSAAFPRLTSALANPNDGTLPDLRVALIDSDLGTGNAYASGSCGPKTLADGTVSSFGDMGRFRMLSAPSACPFNTGAEFLEYKSGRPVDYQGDINSVFACLAGNLGTLGCGEEHSLQAFEFALVAKGIGNERQQVDFLRSSAQLGLIFLSDEDDCSAAPMDAMFGDKPELRGESASLRCATRSHACGGQNLTESPPGYPTDTAFSHPFGDCKARKGDECPSGTDTSFATDCNPLRSIEAMAAALKGLKNDVDQVLVAGIFGWPQTSAEAATATYKIAPVPNPNTADTFHPTVFDYWPVCYDPNHLPSAATTDSATGFDATAAGWGATGGLRHSAFVDQFGESGMKFSVCQPDLTDTMTTIGQVLAGKNQALCMPQKLLDSDLATPGLQPDCRVQWLIPVADPIDPTQFTWQVDPTSLALCAAGAQPGNVTADCWQLAADNQRCPLYGQEIQIVRTAAELAASPQLLAGTKVQMSCRVCPTGGTDPGCAY